MYIVKLHIELTMAALIAKIVKKSVNTAPALYAHRSSRNRGKNYAQVIEATPRGGTQSSTGTFGNDVDIQKADSTSDIPLTHYAGKVGIMKTVTTTVSTADHLREPKMEV